MPTPTNAGLALHPTEKLIRIRAAYRRLLGQMVRDPGATVARDNVRGYLAEIEQALAERAGGEAVAA